MLEDLKMNRWRTILVVMIVVCAAVWASHEMSEQGDATLARTQPSEPARPSPFATPLAVAATESSTPAPVTLPAQLETVVSDVQGTAAVDLTPPNVDTPEPAQAKFARGGRADSNQN
jgi:hypothetical protein